MPEIELTQKKCQPCEGTTKALSLNEAKTFLAKVNNWKLDDHAQVISRDYVAKNFMTAIDFINKVAQLAETENHHPDIHLVGYRKLRIDLSTHAIGGLSENDFIVAAKIDRLPIQLKAGA